MSTVQRNVEAIYPLSPLQQGMLYHSEAAPGCGVYVEQFVFTLTGQLDAAALRSAWAEIVKRHAILRTQFVNLDQQKPRQIVLKQIDLPWQEEDWQSLPANSYADRLAAALADDRKQGFVARRAPLMRVKLIRLEAQTYQLIWSHHHAIADGWSWPIIFKELFAIYKSISQHQAPALPQTRPYRDYINWLGRWHNRQAENYWRDYLRGFEAPTSLPLAHRRQRESTPHTALPRTRQLLIEADIAGAMDALVKREKITLNTLMQGVWALLLSRYSGESDIVFGKVVAGRPAELEGAASIVGPFINTLPLRVKVDPEAGILTWLQQLHQSQIAHITHQFMPLVEIQRYSGIGGGKDLFDSLFVFENYPIDSGVDEITAGSGVKITNLYAREQTHYHLTAQVQPGSGLTFKIIYNANFFDDAGIEQLINHYQVLLQGIATNPRRRLGDLSVLSKRERRRILLDWNNTHQPYSHKPCIHTLFESQVEKTPNAVALEYAASALTYSSLNRHSNRLAHQLLQLGAGPDTRIALAAQPGTELLIGLLAILKAGAAYVPLDPQYPRARLDYMLQHAGTIALLTQRALAPQLPAHRQCLYLDDHSARPQRNHKPGDSAADNTFDNPYDNPTTATQPDHLAYVIYTSGSTGRPKAVAMPHRPLSNLIQWQLTQSGCGAGSRTLQFSACSFDVSFQEIFATWCSGGTLTVMPAELRKDPFSLWSLITRARINRLFMPFIALQQLAEARQAAPAQHTAGALSEVITAGEQLQITPLIRALFQALPDCRLYNHYGPTETHVATAFALPGPAATWEALPAIGRPIANARAYILDQALQPVPAGVCGELYLGGISLARGYLQRDDLTAERFIQNPFVDWPGSRLYKTGDLARYRADGTIEYLGRSDDQVKIRGFRIEPGEIEHVLAAQPSVKTAAVAVCNRGRDSRDKYLAAYLVLEDAAAQDLEPLRQTLLSVLPDYMVPSVLTALPALPLTPSGKIDRRALPAPDADTLTARRHTAPRTAVEQGLLSLWADILDLPADKVGIEDNFFDLGGHSLLATRVVSQIRKTFNIELQIRDLFSASTVKALAPRVEQAIADNPLDPQRDLPLRAIDRNGPLPLSFAQQRLWFIHQFEHTEQTQYNIPWALRLQGPLDIAALQRAFAAVVRRHQSLRTVFRTRDGKAMQVVVDTPAPELPLIESPAMDIAASVAAHASHIFDLSNGPLIRVSLLRLAPHEHILLINLHHIIADGWSMGILNRELSVLYRACADGRASPLPPLPVQYADFAHWQRQWLQGDKLTRQINYWKAQLAGAPALLELPTDRPRPALQRYRGNLQRFDLAADLTQGLYQLGRKRGTTLFMTLLAAFNVLLARYSRQRDICVGTPIANRQRRELEGLIGFFVNTLVMRNQVKSHTRFSELLQQVKQTALSAYAHQDVPFEHLVETLNPERSLSYTPLFQVLFVLQNAARVNLELPAITLSPVAEETSRAKFDLSVFFVESEGKINGGVEYNTDLFDPATIANMIANYQTLLRAIIGNPDSDIAALPLLPEAQRRQLLVDWNQTQTTGIRHDCVHALFESQAEKTPDAVAVEYAASALTYSSLNRHSNRLAHQLLQLGAGPDTRIALAAQPGTELLIGLLAILKAGAAYVPLDPQYPRARLDYMLQHAGTIALLTQRALAPQLPAHRQCLYLDDHSARPQRNHKPGDSAADNTFDNPYDNPTTATQPDHLAYVIYTSGSTGRPKAVAMPHRPLSNLIQWQLTQSGCGAGSRTLQFSACSFDVSFQEIFATWCSGGTLTVMPAELRKDPFSLWSLITRARINRLFMPFIALQQLAEARQAAPAQHTAGALSEVITAGEQLQITPLIRALFQALPDCRLYNHYGPTETHVATAFALPGPAATWEALPAIGRPIANARAYILDQALQPVPAGVCGELYLGGISLARGYLQRDDLTAERFIQNPFVDWPGSRLYKTGDLARYRADGTIEYLGRSDDQVKIRGFRIEPGEIEHVLAAQPSVKTAAVAVCNRGRDSRDKYLAAYLVLEDAAAQDLEPLRQTLLSVLPDYMVPSVLTALPALPLTPSGKIDRRALPAPDADTLTARRHTAPRTAVEQGLLSLWADILDLPADKVGIEDNFFDLGGHSLLATRVVSQIRKTFNIELQIRDLFSASTVKALAPRVEQAIADNPLDPQRDLPLRAIDRNGPLPLSFAQQRLWFIHQFEHTEQTQYNIPWALHLRGPLDIAALQRAFAAVVRRHENLRTTLANADGKAVPLIAANPQLNIPLIDVSDTGAHIDNHIAHIFDLACGPLMSIRLLRLASDGHMLLINMHHIVADAWSAGVLNRELSILYTAYIQGKTSPLPPLPVQYVDFAHWQRQWLQGDKLTRQIDYWKTQLAGAPALLELPTDRPRPATQRYRGSSITFSLPAPLTQQLHRLSRRHNATLFMTLLAAFNVLLARYTGQTDICVGTPVANRQRRELENLIGFFVNTLVLRTRLQGNIGFETLLRQVKNTALCAYAHQDIPFEQLVELLQPQRSLSHSPLFQVLFTLENTGGPVLQLPGIAATVSESESHTAKFDLSMGLAESGDHISAALEYNTDLFDAGTVRRFADHYQRILRSVVDGPEKPLAELDLLSGVERRQILLAWNKTAVNYPQHHCVHQLFQDRAEATPDAVAVVWEGEYLSYGELNRKSNQLAHYLLTQGLGPETTAGLCMRRSADMLVGLLAILKAGAAYVPIDPEYPQQRIHYLIRNSGIAIVLTHKASLLTVAGTQPARHLCLDRQRPLFAGQPGTAPATKVHHLNLAYIIYTSGSTGKPKGVAISHGSLSQLCYWHQRAFNVNCAAKATQLAGIGFDAMGWEVWPYLTAGAGVHPLPQDRVLAPETLPTWLLEQGITHCFAPTPLAESLVTGRWPQRSQLAYLLTGGDRFKQPLSAALPFALVNNYGPTEGTVVSTSGKMQVGGQSAPDIGRAIDNVSTYILDDNLGPAPVGVIGELYIGGHGLARGYWRQPGLTAERFIPHPFSRRAGERLYRTGDLARYLTDGRIDFAGRTDHQVKIRGFRIEIGEIETTLADLPGVREAVVSVHRPGQSDDNLVLTAYLVCDTAAGEDRNALRDQLRQTLPDYMVPAAFVFLDKLPLTANGKIDRRALPPPTLSAEASVAPRTGVERGLAQIWAALLNTPGDSIGLESNFFDLGGHSLLATQVASRIRKAFKVDIPIRDLFSATTVKTLAALIEARSDSKSSSGGEDLPLAPQQCHGPAPLSFAQQRLWFINRFEGGRETQYNIPWALRLSGELHIAALQQAFASVLQRHQSLRTRFCTLEDNTVQLIDDSLALNIAVINVTAATVAEHIDEHAVHVFDLSAGPLIDVKLLRLAPLEHMLLINMHHIVSDGWSAGILNRELSALYGAYIQGRFSALPSLPIQYTDFAHWQRKRLKGDMSARQIDYWRRHLAGAPPLLELPTDRPRPAIQSYRGGSVNIEVPPLLTQQLNELSRQQGTTLFMTLLAAFNVLLARYSGQTDICVGTPVANRQYPELEGLIGFFVNTLVLRSEVKGSATFIELLRQVKRTALSAYAHQDIPFEHLMEVLKPERSLSYNPLFQVLFVLQNAPRDDFQLPGITSSALEYRARTAKFDITISLVESGKAIHGTLEYNTDLFDQSTVERFCNHYCILLEAVARTPEQAIATLQLLSDAEQQQLLREWNAVAAGHGPEQCLPAVFEARAGRHPHAVALVCDDRQLTYGTINRNSNHLAHYLIARGVSADMPVGICLERSPAMVIAILAVLKAGGAYVPLDPGNPVERIRHILDDSGTALVLTQTDQLDGALAGRAAACIALDRDWPEIAGNSGGNPGRHIRPEQLAYIIYTSGSTGRPKGTLITHANVTRLFATTQHQYGFDERDIWTLFHSFAFDFSVWELWGAFYYGGKAIVVPHWVSREPARFYQLIHRQGVTVLNQTPSAFNQLIAVDQALGSDTEQLPLRYIIFGGEALDTRSLQPWFERRGDRRPRLVNMYGITETTVHVTYYPLTAADLRRSGSTIGKRLDDLQVFILDQYLQPVPIGVAGELHVGGSGLARGYRNKPHFSAERFIPNPFSQKPGARLYKSGDMARHLPDGNMEYLGRLDQQVKIRGFRIELGEIEARLVELQGVREAVVLACGRGQHHGDSDLVAYIVAEAAQTLRQSALQHALKARLPDYMLPSLFVFLECLPLTANGKIDRKALPQPDRAARVRQEYIAPRSQTERALAAIWAETLALPDGKVGIEDNFFDLGGHSLLAIRVAGQIDRVFNIELEIRELFIAATIRELAATIEEKIADIQTVASLTDMTEPAGTGDRDEIVI